MSMKSTNYSLDPLCVVVDDVENFFSSSIQKWQNAKEDKTRIETPSLTNEKEDVVDEGIDLDLVTLYSTLMYKLMLFRDTYR